MHEIDDPLLNFCFSETYKLLGNDEKRVLLHLTFFTEPVTKNTINAMTEVNHRSLSIALQEFTKFSFVDDDLEENEEGLKQRYSINPITRSFLKTQLISVPREKEFLEDNYQLISLELENYQRGEVFSMKSVIDKLNYVSHDDKLAASFADSATRIWKTTHNWEEAKRNFEKAKVFSPELGYIYGQWAWVCEQAGKIELARENYHKAVQLDGKNIKLWYQWAVFELLKGDFNGAEDKFHVVLSKNPDDVRSWHGLGRVKFNQYTPSSNKNRIELNQIEKLFERGFIIEPHKQSERKHNINAYYLAKFAWEIMIM